MKKHWQSWVICIDCGTDHRIREGDMCNATMRCGKCYLTWKKEMRKNNDKRNRNE